MNIPHIHMNKGPMSSWKICTCIKNKDHGRRATLNESLLVLEAAGHIDIVLDDNSVSFRARG